MKMRKWLLLGGFLGCAAVVFIIGLIRNPDGGTADDSMLENELVMAENDTEQGTELDESMGEEDVINMMEQLEQDMSTAEEGNIYQQGEAQSFGGFTYQVTAFGLCDSIDDMYQDPSYDERGRICRLDENKDNVKYAWAEVRVTSERGSQQLYPAFIQIVLAQDGHMSIDEYPDAVLNTDTVQVNGVPYNPDDPHNTINPVMEKGETLDLKLYFAYYYSDHYVEEVIKNPEYYVRVHTAFFSSAEKVDVLEEDNRCIFFRCSPEMEGENDE